MLKEKTFHKGLLNKKCRTTELSGIFYVSGYRSCLLGYIFYIPFYLNLPPHEKRHQLV